MVKLEYVWLDGYKPEPNFRSKVKIVDGKTLGESIESFPMWNFDGSSTSQAETGNSDRLLKPVRHYTPPNFLSGTDTIYVLCEVLNPDGTPHESNKRANIGENFELVSTTNIVAVRRGAIADDLLSAMLTHLIWMKGLNHAMLMSHATNPLIGFN